MSDDESTSTVASLDPLLKHSYCDGSMVELQCRRNLNFFHEDDLISILNRYSDTYPNLKSIYIESGHNPDVVRTILLHFVRKHSHSMQSFTLEDCDVSAIFRHENDFSGLIDHSNNKVPLNRSITIEDSKIFGNNTVRKVIENCSFFTSWNLIDIDHVDVIFALNALAQNIYMRSLRAACNPDNSHEEETFIDSIIDVLTRARKMSNLELSFMNKTIVSKRAVADLVDVLINSEVVDSLSFKDLSFANVELLQKFHCLFKNKSNIRTIRLDSNLFCINGNFYASTFSHILQNSIRNNKNCLREFDFDFLFMNCREISQEIISMFALLKDSCIEKLAIRSFRSSEVFLTKRLLIDTIPFIRQLCYFHCNDYNEWDRDLQKTFFKSIGYCSRTLAEVETPVVHVSAENGVVENRMKKCLKRNKQLTSCIESKTKFCRSAWPKLFYISKPTGPDATFHFLCNLGHSVGPDNNTMTTTTEQLKRKFL